MGKCNIDHSRDDVLKKLHQQQEFLPETLVVKIRSFLGEEQPQGVLNDLFHLLKKYDLAEKGEQEKRNGEMTLLLA
ncbi:MAG TPA: hypothetical protein VK142_06215 [Bacillota bacterium]|nr:hypothetical protein [Bacillota bacterium]